MPDLNYYYFSPCLFNQPLCTKLLQLGCLPTVDFWELDFAQAK